MKPNFWTADTAARFSAASPEFMRELYVTTCFAINWWRENMSLLDRIILRLFPNISPFCFYVEVKDAE